MKKDIVIYGSGGFGREVLELIKDINKKEDSWRILGFIDDNPENHGKVINGFEILGGKDWVENYHYSLAVTIAIGNPKIRKLVSKELMLNHVDFPNLIHPSVSICEFVNLGKGNIICAGNIITTDITMGNFIIINLSCTVGHDVTINSFCTILPGSNISGNVILEEGVDIGTQTCIIPTITIGRNSIIGAGSTVIRDIPSDCTAVGSPAKPIKFHVENLDESVNSSENKNKIAEGV